MAPLAALYLLAVDLAAAFAIRAASGEPVVTRRHLTTLDEATVVVAARHVFRNGVEVPLEDNGAGVTLRVPAGLRVAGTGSLDDGSAQAQYGLQSLLSAAPEGVLHFLQIPPEKGGGASFP